MANWQYLLIGLGSGLAVAFIIWAVMAMKRARAKSKSEAEIKKYKDMIAQRMELESEGLSKYKAELEEVKRQNENLRVTVQALQQKPGRSEINRLQVYQRAVDRMMINSPGFGPVWQTALKESEDEFKKINTGFIPFIRRHIPGKTDASLIEDADVQD